MRFRFLSAMGIVGLAGFVDRTRLSSAMGRVRQIEGRMEHLYLAGYARRGPILGWIAAYVRWVLRATTGRLPLRGSLFFGSMKF